MAPWWPFLLRPHVLSDAFLACRKKEVICPVLPVDLSSLQTCLGSHFLNTTSGLFPSALLISFCVVVDIANEIISTLYRRYLWTRIVKKLGGKHHFFWESKLSWMSTFLCPTDGVRQLCSPPAASQPHPPPGLWNRCFPANVCFHQCGPQRRGESHTRATLAKTLTNRSLTPVKARPQTHTSTKLGCLWKTTWEIRSLSHVTPTIM